MKNPCKICVSVACAVVTTSILTLPADAKRRTTGNDASNSNSNSSNGNGSSQAKKLPMLPSGWINASPAVVQAGTKPMIKWAISHPSIVEDYVTIEPPSTIVADETLDCEVRIIGAGVTVSSSNSQSYQFVPTQALINPNGSGYTQIFYGTNPDVDPNEVVWSGEIAKNGSLKFGGRYKYNENWGPYFNSDSGTMNVRTLVNGDVPPSNVPEYNAPSLESFIKPYLSADGKVNIGPMDCIVFMELTHQDSQQSNAGYDLQDMVILVTFTSQVKGNNGHGNNIDGIDSSNPGNAPFIDLDTDPTVDDEK